MTTFPPAGPGQIPGWSDQDYAEAGIAGREAARRFRRLWLPPKIAGVMRAAQFTVDDIEALAQTTAPAVLLHAVEANWLTKDGLLAFGYHQMQGAWDLKTWVTAGLDAIDCWTLRHSYKVRPDDLGRYVAQADPPLRWLPDVFATAHGTFGVAMDDLTAWLPVAASMRAKPDRIEQWNFLGGLTGLFVAAGLTPKEATAKHEEYRRLPRHSREETISSLLSLAAVRGHRIELHPDWTPR